MTNLPWWKTTAGLNVPADSHPSPCGETIGSIETRCHPVKTRSAFCARTRREQNSRASPAFRRMRRVSPIVFPRSFLRQTELFSQLLEEQTDRLNPAMEVRDVKLLVRGVQIIVRQAEAHHDAGNLQHVLEVGHDGD